MLGTGTGSSLAPINQLHALCTRSIGVIISNTWPGPLLPGPGYGCVGRIPRTSWLSMRAPSACRCASINCAVKSGEWPLLASRTTVLPSEVSPDESIKRSMRSWSSCARSAANSACGSTAVPFAAATTSPLSGVPLAGTCASAFGVTTFVEPSGNTYRIFFHAAHLL